MALFESRADLLPATRAGMKKPLGPILVGEKQSDRLLAKKAIARFDRNRHEEFFLASRFNQFKRPGVGGFCSMANGGIESASSRSW
jgi:hypothetical protein